MTLENSHAHQPKKRILSGMRPTGKLHLGNYYGALDNWFKLQKEYECFYFVADWHALTTEYESAGNIRDYIPEMLMDWLAVGLDPEKSTLFVQSALPEHAELYLIFGMFTPVPWLERNPTYKDQVQELSHKDLATYGFLGYPVLQAADILMYKAHGVPVGVDQVPHVEMTRDAIEVDLFIALEIIAVGARNRTHLGVQAHPLAPPTRSQNLQIATRFRPTDHPALRTEQQTSRGWR